MSISFNHADRKFGFARKPALKKYLTLLAREVGREIDSLAYVFCSDNYLLELNQQFLQHDTLTDIITFDLSMDANGPITGEIYISVDRVADNAKTFGVEEEQEQLRVIFHGLLHLCGYKDKTAAQKKKMRAAEERHLQGFAAFKK